MYVYLRTKLHDIALILWQSLVMCIFFHLFLFVKPKTKSFLVCHNFYGCLVMLWYEFMYDGMYVYMSVGVFGVKVYVCMHVLLCL